MVLNAALNRYKNNNSNSDSNTVKKNIYLPLIPVELKWNINLN